MASNLELGSRKKSRREVLEDHIKNVAAHALMSVNASETLKSHSVLQDEDGKENIQDYEIHLSSKTRTKLKQIGAIYSDGNISSPIQRTEEKFCLEEETERPAVHNEARSARLARLANVINQWEDDTSHPVIPKPQVNQKKKLNPKFSASHKAQSKPCVKSMKVKDNIVAVKDNGSESKGSLKRDAEPPKDSLASGGKRVMWDSTVIASLENQGFERCESKQHLVYDYGERKSPAKCLSPSRKSKDSPLYSTPSICASPSSKSPSKSTPIKEALGITSSPTKRDFVPALVREMSPVKVSRPSEASGMVNKISTSLKTSKDEVKTTSTSPRKNSQVLEMAAQYEESNSPSKRVKETDPSELPLSQRMALFERNKGSAILPKAPFSQAVPPKVLASSQLGFYPIAPASKTSPVKLSNGYSSEQKLKQIREEREREIQVLKSRWDKNRQMTDDVYKSDLPNQDSTVPQHSSPVQSKFPLSPNGIPRAPPLPEHFDSFSRVEDAEGENLNTSEMSSELVRCPDTAEVLSSPSKLDSSYPMLSGVKKIRVSPPKPGRLYPSISDIETETESECNEPNVVSGYDNDSLADSECSTVASLGQTIVQVARKSATNLKRYNDSTSEEEVRVLGEMDEFLDEALGEPSPPKKSRDSSFDSYMDNGLKTCDTGSIASDSFEFGKNSSDLNQVSSDVNQGPQETQLIHTISLYRKQKQMTIKTTTTTSTIKKETIAKFNKPSSESSDGTSSESESEAVERTEEQLVTDRIHDLSLEVSRQLTVISQATQALNLCTSTIEFSGSVEQTEAEKLLLIASQRRLALQHEIDRLRVEKSLKPGGRKSNEISPERGDLSIQNITLPLKMDVIRASAREEKCWYVVVLARCGPTVVASDMLPALPKNLKQSEPYLLRFPSSLNFKGLYSDFAVTLEVYALETRSKELLPHDVKYHITPSAKKTLVSQSFALLQALVSPKSFHALKEKLRITPKKGPKNDTRLIIGPIESPAGPSAVRSSSFKLNGFAVFSLQEIGKTSFSLSKVLYGSLVEGSIQLKLSCEMTLQGFEYRGFLTMFRDVSGFGAWHRRWCYLKDNTISYWLYPEHETTKIPVDTIDLTEVCTEEVGLVSRDICARPNTFLLEVVRPKLPTDEDSLVMKTSKHSTVIKHLMSADTREDRMEWCNRINKCLSLLKAWGKRPSVKHTQL